MAWYAKRSRKAPQQRASVVVSLPVPTGGVNLSDAPQVFGPGDAWDIINMVPGSNGLEVRWGTIAHADISAGTFVRSLMSFSGGDSANSRLFCASPSGIFDVTSTGTALPSVTFGTTSGQAGFGVSASFTTIAGEFLLHCDEENGYHVYTQSTDSWAAVASGTGASQVSGIDPANAVFVASWKNRVWFVERDTANGWYLPVGQIYGTATKFNFGSRFAKGGELAGLWSWTRDGGRGIDDYLVAVSTAGELLIFEGTDPDTFDAFNLVGSWDLGSVPAGRRFASEVNGDILIVTKAGLVSVSKLRSGSSLDEAAGIARKVKPWFPTIFSTDPDDGWIFLTQHPGERALWITSPYTGVSLVLAFDSGAWSSYAHGGSLISGLWASVVHGEDVYLGDSGSSVIKSATGKDGQSIGGSGGTDVNWRWISGPVVRDFVSHKTISQARARFVGSAPTGWGFTSYYEFTSAAGLVPFVSGAASSGWTGVRPEFTSTVASGRETFISLGGDGHCVVAGLDVDVLSGGDA